jgi:iron-sulfur cluster repair protein YtfE (RIC family)
MIASTGKTPERTGVSMLSTTHIDIASTVNEIVAQYPETMPVFNRFGIDSCCGGGVPLAALQEAIERR